METTKSEVLRKKLSRMSTQQLLERVEEENFTKSEMKIAEEILARRTKKNVEKATKSKKSKPSSLAKKVIDKIYSSKDKELIERFEKSTTLDSNSTDTVISIHESKVLSFLKEEEHSIGNPNTPFVSYEEVVEIINLIYDTADEFLIKELCSIFKKPVDDYSELSQEERVDIQKYLEKVETSILEGKKKTPPKKSSKKKTKTEKRKKESKPKKVTKSQKMRDLYRQGKTIGEIAKEVDAHYSFVYGVIQRYKKALGQ